MFFDLPEALRLEPRDGSAPPLAPEALYLPTVPAPSFAVLHAPVAPGCDTATLFCPPFGWDEVFVHRSLRNWADSLASVGVPVLRLSLPSTGDSGGQARDPDRLAVWADAVSDGARWLRQRTGVARVAVVGLDLGGVVAYVAATRGAPIDDLVLWATPARGRSLVRRLAAFAALDHAASPPGAEREGPVVSEHLDVAGFLLNAGVREDLLALDLAAVPPPSQVRRILLLGRDGVRKDQPLVDRLQGTGIEFACGPGHGYSVLTSGEDSARLAAPTAEFVNDWVLAASSSHASAPTVPVNRSDRVTSIRGSQGGLVVEEAVSVEQDFGRMSGVLVEPSGKSDHGLCLVMLNAGVTRRTGPSRVWVDASRRWAEKGVPTFRLDFGGIGESDGDDTRYGHNRDLYLTPHVPQIVAALDWLEHRGSGRTFVLVGLCSGAFWALHGTLSDMRVRGAFMINLPLLVWDEQSAAARDFRAFSEQPLSIGQVRRALRSRRIHRVGAWMFRSVAHRLAGLISFGRAASNQGPTDAEILRRLAQRHVRTHFVFGLNERLEPRLKRRGYLDWFAKIPGVSIDHIPVEDHTVRANWAQAHLHMKLDQAVEAELSMLAADGREATTTAA